MNFSNWLPNVTAAEIMASIERVSRELGPPPPPPAMVREVPRTLLDLQGEAIVANVPEVRWGGLVVAPAARLVVVNPPLIAETPCPRHGLSLACALCAIELVAST